MQAHAQITDLIYFHGITLQVITFEGVQYVPAKPLVELAGNIWRRSKFTINDGDNAILYGTQVLKITNLSLDSHTSVKQTDQICMRLDRIYMFFARISTNHMKAKGNVEAAEELLELQIEWAKALNDYETKGVAFKDKNKSTRLELIQLIKARSMVKDLKEHSILTQMIHQVMSDLGFSIKGQNDLF